MHSIRTGKTSFLPRRVSAMVVAEDTGDAALSLKCRKPRWGSRLSRRLQDGEDGVMQYLRAKKEKSVALRRPKAKASP